MRYLLPGVVLIFGLITSVQSAVAEESHEAFSTFKDCDLCPEMVVIPAGSFMMGLPEVEGSQRQVSIAAPFAIGKFEVTFDEWDACVMVGSCDDAVSDRSWGRGRRPVMMVTWLGAKSYVEWLSERTGQSYRLPSGAEWEYAARAGTTTPFSTGQTITTGQSNFKGTYTYNGSSEGIYREQTVVVGSFTPNAFGLHDAHGNVSEWVEDCRNMVYQDAPIDGAAWLSGDCDRRVLRGGYWGSKPSFLRSGLSKTQFTNYPRDSNGLRVARDLDP